MTLTPAQLDRVVGALLGTAAGDALGAPYEFGPPRGPELEVVMNGGGAWEPGEWTDDTSMAIVIAEAAAAGADLCEEIEPDANPNLDFVLIDTVRLIEQLRNEGRTVLLHCVACQSRTPTVAALYAARKGRA